MRRHLISLIVVVWTATISNGGLLGLVGHSSTAVLGDSPSDQNNQQQSYESSRGSNGQSSYDDFDADLYSGSIYNDYGRGSRSSSRRTNSNRGRYSTRNDGVQQQSRQDKFDDVLPGDEAQAAPTVDNQNSKSGGILGGLLGGDNSGSPLTSLTDIVTRTLMGKSNSFMWLLDPDAKDTKRDGFIIDEGDLAIGDHDVASKTMRDINTWSGGHVYYIFDQSVDEKMVLLIQQAMKEWEQTTCVRFHPKGSVDTTYYLNYRTDKPGCYSFVGKQLKDFGRGQDVNLGRGCENLHTAIHEIGHALGLSHEQSRSDRDTYLKVNFVNIQPAFHGQFASSKTKNELAEYDYKSVMQYPSWGFSKAPFNKITMSTINPLFQYLIDEERQGLTFKDIKVMNIMYECQQKCPRIPKNQDCANGGYRIPYKDLGPCPCICPPGYRGDYCDQPTLAAGEPSYGLAYYGGLRCGGNVTNEGTISTIGYPRRTLQKPGCSWWITAPRGSRIRLEFEDFSFREPESIGQIRNKCIYEKVEIRTRNIYDPDIFCGEQLKGQAMVSQTETLIVVIVPDLRFKESLQGRGLKASVFFVAPEG